MPDETRGRGRRRTAVLVLGGVIAIAAALGMPAARWLGWDLPAKPQRIVDKAGILPPGVRENAEQYVESIYDESDVDVRIILQRGGGAGLERLAPELMRDLGAGAKGRRQRGLLIVYDARSGKGRIEVGYGLEEYFPDGLVGYLLRNHVETLFASGNPTQGIHLLLRMLHHRIRQAALDQRFDPHVLDVLEDRGPLSGGAGATAAMPLGAPGQKIAHQKVSAPERAQLGPQPSPEAAYRAYLAWLAAGRFDPSIELFTPETRRYLSGLPITPGYFAEILLNEFGQQYRIVTRRDLALLAFTSTPLVSPHFFTRTARGWQMDLLAEVMNTANITGGVYTWTYRGRDDPYTLRFLDEIYEVDGYYRLLMGDNRMLPVRNRHRGA